MIRPAIQARRKLIFLYLLRSSSALATSEPPIAPGTKPSLSSPSSGRAIPHHKGHIALRVATRTDVPAIQRCNLATLPENYSSNFYVNHLRQWPDLALVAEHVVEDNDSNSNNSFISRNPFDNYDASKPQNEIIGYVLGKVEETAILIPPPKSPNPSKVDKGGAAEMWGNPNASEFQKKKQQQQRGTEMLGHVTSLAILPTFRRRGLAAKLMKQLHYHMQEGHGADGVGLHVRVSNVAARRLYCEGMGYGVVDVIRGYYQDGEDAFFMRKEFESEKSGTRQQVLEEGNANGTNGNGKRLSRFSLSRMRRGVGRYNSDAYQNGPKEYMLPIIIPLDNETDSIDVDADSTEVSAQQDDVQVVAKEPEKKRQTVSQSQFQKIPSTIKSKSKSQYQKIPSSTSTTSTRTVVNASTAEEGSTKVMSGSL